MVDDGRSTPGFVSLVEAFWADSSPHVRRLLIDEAGGRSAGRVKFEFDMFDVTLDFDAGTVTISDALSASDSESIGLMQFLERAALFGDHPAMGDGLTQMERQPPTFEVDARGNVEPLRGDRP